MTSAEQIDLNAYLDGELGPDEAAEIEARLAEDPEAQARLDAYGQQKHQIAEALTGIASAGPAPLRTARLEKRLAARLHSRAAPRRVFAAGPWLQGMTQIAAAVALVAFGWWGHASWTPTLISTPSGVPEYVSEALGAHTVFAEDIMRPAEFTGGDVDGAVEWFSAKMGVPVNVPDLGSYGMFVVGARLLGTKEGPLAQFIYEDGAGERYSLTLSKHPDNWPVTPLQVVDYPDRAVGYWSTSHIDFVLIGKADGGAIPSLSANLSQKI
jgi:anti-sigma factor RsiW